MLFNEPFLIKILSTCIRRNW